MSSTVSLGLMCWYLLDPSPARGPLVLWCVVSYCWLVGVSARPFGLADGISSARVALACAAALIHDAPVLQASLFGAAIASDALDGYLARRFGATKHGEVLDMEADQTLVLMLAVAVSQVMALGALALLLPALKYIFTLLETLLGLSAGAAKPVRGDNRRARLIYGVVLTSLFAGLPALQSPSLFQALLAIAIPLLLWSFVADLRHKRRAGLVSAS